MSAAGSTPLVVAAAPADASAQRRARQLAARLNAPLAALDALPSGAIVLVVGNDSLALRHPSSQSGDVTIDFAAGARGASADGRLSRRQPLGRAVGAAAEHVFDATAGLGGDAARLARMGYRVTAVERSAVLALMLEDALEHAQRDPALREAVAARLRIIHADARDLLRRNEIHPDAVYIDPMYPPKKRASALPRKEIQLLRKLVGDDADAAELLELARAHSPRVIVKRPAHAPPLAAKPTAQIESKLARFDVYSRSCKRSAPQ